MSARLRGWLLAACGALMLAAAARGSVASDWKEIEAVSKRVDAFNEKGGKGMELFNNLNLLSFRLADFIAAHPEAPRRWDAELLRLQTEAHLMALKGERVDWADQAAGYAAVAAAPGASAETRVTAQAGNYLARLSQLARDDRAGRVALAAEVDAFYGKNRQHPRLAEVAMKVAEWVEPADSPRAESILRKIAKAGDGEIPARAEALLRVVQLKRQPLEVAFTAIDGRKVDLKNLRGKVVLLDFWATWCPPCREETPELLAAYRRYREQGFEIVGISLDDNKRALTDYVKKHGMDWPQYYDGQGWDNKFSRNFGIKSIPAMWLVGKDGMLMSTEGRDDLAGKIERLLSR